MIGEPGSVGRAILGWRATASAMLPIWIGLVFLSPSASRSNEGFEDLAFLLLMLITYCLGVLVVVPAFAFTIGRWSDRRTAPRGLRASLIPFGIYGFGFGLMLALLLGVSGLTPVGVLAVIVAPTLAAVLGRLLVELRGRLWNYVLWGTFGVAVAVALALILTAVTNR
ncbi:hypothetical protein [Demequina sp.]|uniref:hypothetical protein n=1 Tax=Demequina sp. TaxID=2050685 RepID=UPI003D109B4D